MSPTSIPPALTTMPLARLTLLKSAAYLNDSATTYDEEYALALTQATALISRACSRALELADYEEQLVKGGGTTRLYFPEWPVLVDEDHELLVQVWDGSTWATIDDAHYLLTYLRYLDYPVLGTEGAAAYGAWPCSTRENIALTYSAGYDTTDGDTLDIDEEFGVPADLEAACAMLAAHLWRQKGSAGVASEAFGPRSISYRVDGQEIPDEVMCMLAPYMRVSF